MWLPHLLATATSQAAMQLAAVPHNSMLSASCLTNLHPCHGMVCVLTGCVARSACPARYDNMDVTLFERLEAEGLAVEEVCEPDCQLPPPSPPPFSSLFPDMRIAVFKIYRAS